MKDVHPFEKDLIGMCIRYPMMASRSSSVKSELESVDVSEDRLSLNSTNRIKFATIKLLGNV